jgi:hypothetical protein
MSRQRTRKSSPRRSTVEEPRPSTDADEAIDEAIDEAKAAEVAAAQLAPLVPLPNVPLGAPSKASRRQP